MTTGYQNHFHTPNPFTEEATPTTAGHGYFYTYGNALFIMINANNYNAADHEALIKKAVYASQNLCYTIADMKQGTLRNPKGVFYMSSNSATGSKFYELIPQQQDYIAARNQDWRPTYSVIRITKTSFTIDTYDVETGKPIDESYSIIKD